MSSIAERIAMTEARLKELRKQKQAAEAKKRAAENKRERAAETRKKILLGAMLAGWMETNPETKDRVLAHLNTSLTRDDDRKLFELPPKA